MEKDTLGNFLTLTRDMWLKFNHKQVVVLGNGPSKNDGVLYIRENNSSYISINTSIQGRDPLFVLATRETYAMQLSEGLPFGVPILVPSSFAKNPRWTYLDVSNINYLEGITDEGLLFREDFVLATALNILELIFNKEPKPNQVVLFGFDFILDLKQNSKYTGIERQFMNSLLEKQRELFQSLLKSLEVLGHLSIINMSKTKEGIKYSKLDSVSKSVPFIDLRLLRRSIEKNNVMLSTSLTDARDGKVQIVAELTNNHLGDTQRLEEMVRSAKEQGANIIKIQKRDVSTLYTEAERKKAYTSPFGTTLGEYREGVELSIDQIRYLSILCSELEIPWFSSVLDQPSMVMLSEFDLLCIKAPSTISNHKNFLESIASSNVEWIMISTGGTNEEFLSWINKKFQSKNLILMQCTSSYPTAPEDCNVNVIKTISHLKSSSMLIPGYSSHDRGSLASQLAVSLGASILEKHVTLGSVEWVHFDGVALDLSVDQLGKFVRDIEVAKTILGSARKQKLNSEHHKYVPNEKHN